MNLDPDNTGDIAVVSKACIKGTQCHRRLMSPLDGGFGGFDIAYPALDPFPRTHYFGFLNQDWV